MSTVDFTADKLNAVNGQVSSNTTAIGTNKTNITSLQNNIFTQQYSREYVLNIASNAQSSFTISFNGSTANNYLQAMCDISVWETVGGSLGMQGSILVSSHFGGYTTHAVSNTSFPVSGQSITTTPQSNGLLINVETKFSGQFDAIVRVKMMNFNNISQIGAPGSDTVSWSRTRIA